jgi:selenocysteine lyase/cysteine desulfurase
LSNIPSLIILGSQTVSRLAIFSFLIYVPMIKKYLHYNFICSLLNDLFGIQVRSGCACAGPYALVKRIFKQNILIKIFI